MRKRSNHGEDMPFFIFQDGGRRYLGFLKFKFLTVGTV